MGTQIGSRKLTESRETALLLLVGMLVCAWLKADVQLYFGFAAAVVGKTASFAWGNAKEHESRAKAVPA